MTLSIESIDARIAEIDKEIAAFRALGIGTLTKNADGEKRALLALRVLLIEGEAVAALHSESTLYVQPLLDDVRAAYEGETP